MDERDIHLILIDGKCLSCHKIVEHIHKHDQQKIFYFASQQLPLGQRLLDKYGLRQWEGLSIIYLQKGRPLILSTAVLAIYGKMTWPLRWLSVFTCIPHIIRDGLYLLYARNRYRLFGELNLCKIPEPELAKRFMDG
jgi:predicted DCC family thiol-disulfide oxidoreductase YuxK